MVTIIAEIGENHCGNMDWAKQMIRIASNAGCDYAKFQLYDSAKTSDDDPERDWFLKVQLDRGKVRELIQECESVKIRFLCTPWDSTQAEILFNEGVEDIKIASFLITDSEMLQQVNKKAKKVFISSGMSSLEEIDHAMKLLGDVDVYLMHCVSEYPLVAKNVNLNVMDTLREKYPNAKIGYSDHTVSILAPVLAVAKGALVIEKHVTLDKALEGTDHILSADPLDLKVMVEQIRIAEKMLGSTEKKTTPSELQNQDFLRNRFRH